MAKKRNQAAKKKEWFNFDKAIALLVIIALFVIIKSAFTPPEAINLLEQTKINLEEEAEIIMDKLTNGKEIKLLNSNVLVEEEVNKLNQMDYKEVKNMLGVKNDFCIYFEDITGNVIRIDGISPGIGSNKIYINGKPCE